MPPRATWKGHVKLSLVSFAVRVHNATSTAERVALNQLHKECNLRLKQKMVCPEHGDVQRDEIVKGYEYEKGRYVIVEPDDLEHIQLETTKTIEIVQFVDRDELPGIYLDAPYYVAPDGPVAQEAFAVIRQAMEASNKVGIGLFVIAGRERIAAIEPEGQGMLMTTLRSDKEVRKSAEFFADIPEVELDPKQIELAEQLIKSNIAELDTTIFRDRYQEAMLAMIMAKIEGAEPAVVEEAEVAHGLNFMDALQASIQDATDARKKVTKKPPAKSVRKKGAGAKRGAG